VLCLAGWIAHLRKRQLDTRTMLGIPELESDPAAASLITQGIYARMRNPRYLEVFFGLLGISLIANYLGAYWTVLWSLPTLQVIVLLEERELRERFGEEYEAYAQRVPRWLPLVFKGPKP
jgi:protein-S-isoprenylcysteine O-methyltransferase Ste14